MTAAVDSVVVSIRPTSPFCLLKSVLDEGFIYTSVVTEKLPFIKAAEEAHTAVTTYISKLLQTGIPIGQLAPGASGCNEELNSLRAKYREAARLADSPIPFVETALEHIRRGHLRFHLTRALCRFDLQQRIALTNDLRDKIQSQQSTLKVILEARSPVSVEMKQLLHCYWEVFSSAISSDAIDSYNEKSVEEREGQYIGDPRHIKIYVISQFAKYCFAIGIYSQPSELGTMLSGWGVSAKVRQVLLNH